MVVGCLKQSASPQCVYSLSVFGCKFLLLFVSCFALVKVLMRIDLNNLGKGEAGAFVVKRGAVDEKGSSSGNTPLPGSYGFR